jgi:Domain of unknown function (DUF4920)
MLKKITVAILAVVMLASCSSNKNKPSANAVNDGKHFGNHIDGKKAMSYEQLMVKMEKTDAMDAKVSGKISGVCQKKGCWMMMISDQPGKPEMRVTFKNYAFFMPKDLAGKRVVIDGKASVTVTSVADLRHYAEDAKKSKAEIEAIKEPLRELTFEAAGVLILE